ncbi:polysaccharide biosynthesis/export family protein [Bacteroidales bacterium OttesenSCG-928-I14]|nr:polysaccharide biosynthesis/export family protein [Bacteroidales bacterium OttesenSCG-928-I14]
MKLKITLFSLLTIILFSCKSVPKDIAYFDDLEEYMAQTESNGSSAYEPIIKNNDQLLITVSSPQIDQAEVAQFNLPMNTFLAPGETIIAQSAAVQTYTVDKYGNINFPTVGKLNLSGKTKSEAVDYIAEKISAYVEEPIVNLQIISYKVTVIGQVLTPGTIKVTDERMTIFEALGAAGDMTIHGNRKNVKVVRENNGKKEEAILDLTKSNILSSPYYYLQQNDIVYVEPNKAKKKESLVGTADTSQIQALSIVFTAITAVATTANIIFNILK